MCALIDNPIIYHLFIDRFNGWPNAASDNPLGDAGYHGAFFGGTLSGVTRKLVDGWFSRLGVNAILISAPYEQIRGWVPGGGGRFKHYAYHGYYALDYTCVDSRFGARHDLRELVECSHDQGIAVLMDIVMNHPGYPDLQTLSELGIDALQSGWQTATPQRYECFLNTNSLQLRDWWGPEWVRSNLPGYCPGGEDDHTRLLEGLPDFKTESSAHVSLPAFLKRKPDTRAKDLPGTTVRGYLIHWLTAWVREYGIDGFRCDSVRHVEPEAWAELKSAAVFAKSEWCAQQGLQADHSPFCMMGEVFGHGVEPSPYFDKGFDSLINFDFQQAIGRGAPLDDLYHDYAIRLCGRPGYNHISYLSSHDTVLFDRRALIDGATALMLAPGGVLIFYGDETARPAWPGIEEDSAQSARSPMNWGAMDEDVLAHWRKLGQFRTRHIALARGAHLCLQQNPYVFARLDVSGDRVVVAIRAHGELEVPVSDIFDDGIEIRDAYSGWRGPVCNGRVCLAGHGVVLLEACDDAGAHKGGPTS